MASGMRHPITREPLDCGDSSCVFAVEKGGMRTNGGCRCLENLYHMGLGEGVGKARAIVIGWLRALPATPVSPRELADILALVHGALMAGK